MTDTEFVPITEVEVEMTVGELLAILSGRARIAADPATEGTPTPASPAIDDGGSGCIAADTIERLTEERDEARAVLAATRRALEGGESDA